MHPQPQDGRGYFMLPQGPEGAGYYVYGTPARGAGQYVHPSMMNLLLYVERVATQRSVTWRAPWADMTTISTSR